ncbi:MAG: thioredoxin family protein [Candidatus Heimdallarchaeota archaeon]|nr:thioredoxin family protein [Candidatus Heimdallarchaeota archaeon]MDH5644680.1 thioredoxin family protein [Candidatus Heimdallarchaeota archaeon]
MNPTEIGSKPPDFYLKGTDDKFYSLDSFNHLKYIAIIFSCNHCPYVVASEREFNMIQEKYKDRSFSIIAINPNAANPNYPGDSFDNMKARVKEKNFNFPYLVDINQDVARKYMATKTPEIFLYDEHRKLVYHGRINDNPKFPNEVNLFDLQNSLEQLISGQIIQIPKTQPLGCSIKYIEI